MVPEHLMVNMAQDVELMVGAASILATVLAVYGAFIKSNFQGFQMLRQRLLGADEDDTDAGFLEETTSKLDNLGEKMDHHHEEVEQGIYETRQRVEDVERKTTRIEYKVDAVAEVVEDEHDVLFRGEGNADKLPDGGEETEEPEGS